MNSISRMCVGIIFATVAVRAGVPSEGVAVIDRGWQLWEAGKFSEARTHAERTLRQDSENAEARHLMVLTSFVNGGYHEGLEHYALLDPDYDRIRELDGLVLDVLKALRQFDRAETFARQVDRSENVVTMLRKQRDNPMKVSLDKTTVVPFSQEHMIPDWMPAIPIEINGREYLGHLDTGGNWVHMSPKMASELGIETVFVGMGRGNNQETTVEQGIVDTLKIGDAVLKNVSATAIAALQGTLRDGKGEISDLVILGNNVLEQFLTTWDNDKQRLVLSPRYDLAARREHFSKYVPDEAMSMDFYRVPDHYLIAHGAIAGRDATFFVDTGLVTVDSNGRQPGLSISSESFKAFGGKGDFTEAGFADTPGPIRLGPVELENQGLYVSPGARGFSFSGVKTDALLSHGFLKHCVWTIDFDTRTWYLHSAGQTAAAPVRVEIADADSYVGSYEVAPGVMLEVTTLGGDLYLQAPGQQKAPLVADTDGAFSIPMAGAQIVFERDDTGRITGLVLKQAGNQTHATKQ